MNAPRAKRGGILLEVMVALTIMLMAAMTIGGIVTDSVSEMMRSRTRMQACDLARSTMAQIEAGLVDPSAINGPIERWNPSQLLMPEDAGPGAMPIGSPESESLSPLDPSAGSVGMVPVPVGIESDETWQVELDTEPTEYDGLYLVRVTAWLERDGVPGNRLGQYTLRQIVRLGTQVEDVAGEEDDLMDAARRGLGAGGGP